MWMREWLQRRLETGVPLFAPDQYPGSCGDIRGPTRASPIVFSRRRLARTQPAHVSKMTRRWLWSTKKDEKNVKFYLQAISLWRISILPMVGVRITFRIRSALFQVRSGVVNTLTTIDSPASGYRGWRSSFSPPDPLAPVSVANFRRVSCGRGFDLI